MKKWMIAVGLVVVVGGAVIALNRGQAGEEKAKEIESAPAVEENEPDFDFDTKEEEAVPNMSITGTVTAIEDTRMTIQEIEGESFTDDTLIVYWDEAGDFVVGDKVEVDMVGMTMSIPAQAVKPTVTKVN